MNLRFFILLPFLSTNFFYFNDRSSRYYYCFHQYSGKNSFISRRSCLLLFVTYCNDDDQKLLSITTFQANYWKWNPELKMNEQEETLSRNFLFFNFIILRSSTLSFEMFYFFAFFNKFFISFLLSFFRQLQFYLNSITDEFLMFGITIQWQKLSNKIDDWIN